ncbi:MAG: 3,4-dehydroadipyl-CoA semialdehyde dehydrogenase [Sandaracinaceae bacterium]|nr:3,4-dehydroadipyl-CoA semialdehyde dehydrogenase [Sandaracinaceae bacterium]
MFEVQSHLTGTWVRGKREHPLFDPSSEERVGTAWCDPPLEGVLEAARAAGPGLRARSFGERGAMLDALSKTLRNHREELIDVSIRATGSTRADAKFDIDGGIGTMAYYAGIGSKLGNKRSLVEPGEALTKDPRFYGMHLWVTRPGVALHINAFNFPAWNLAEKLSVAILAGVPVISKPATSTSILAHRMAQIIVESGVLPQNAFQFLVGKADGILEALGPQDHIVFTGSASTGAKLRQTSAVVHRSTRLNIEADSLNSAWLLPEVAPGSEVYQAFMRDVIKEITQKAGQKCTATRRIFIHRSIIDTLQSELIEGLEGVRIGHPSLEEVHVGPLATRDQVLEFHRGVEALIGSGARLVFGDPKKVHPIGVPEGKGYFVPIILLRADNPKQSDAVHQIEVFGPCATLCPYDSIEEGGELICKGDGSLVASIYGEERESLRRALDAIAPFHGRMLVVNPKVVGKTISPGTVLPSCIHGGPGRAGGGEELGGERALRFYMQRVALQGDRAFLEQWEEGQ